MLITVSVTIPPASSLTPMPIAKGLALGTAAHAIGTEKALELGEIEGAMSSLSIAVAGLLTVVVVPLMSGLI